MSMRGIQDAYPLSHVQHGLLYHAIQREDRDDYLAHVTLLLNGTLDEARLRHAWATTVARYSALRATFVWEGVDEALQVIHSSVTLPWQHIDCTRFIGRRASRIEQEIAHERAEPLDVRRPPLMRFRLLQFSDTDATLLWTVHHLLADGWSTPIIVNSVFDAYRVAELPNAEVASAVDVDNSYKRYVMWQRGQDSAAATAHWSEYLKTAAATPLCIASIARSNDDQTCKRSITRPVDDTIDGHDGHESSHHVYTLDAAKTQHIMHVCQQAQLTLASVIVSAWALLLRSYCHSDRPLFGVTVAGRPPAIRDVESAVGLYISTLPLLVDCTSTLTTREWLSGLQTDLRAHSEHDHLPLSTLQSCLNDEPGQAMFDTVVAIEGHHGDLSFESGDRSLRGSDLDYRIQSHFPLSLLVMPGDRLRCTLVRNPERLGAEIVGRMAEYFGVCLQAVINGVTQPTSVQSLVDEVNKASPATMVTSLPAPSPALDEAERGPLTSLVQGLESIVDSQPHAAAIIYDGNVTTFSELDALANRLANGLLKQVQPGDLVALSLPRGVNQLAALWAVLKAGCAYLPVDPDYPQGRVQLMLDSAQPALMVVTEALECTLSAPCGVRSVSSLLADNAQRPCVPVDDQTLAYVMYTSGSTGIPKGVEITHGNLIYSTAERHRFYSMTTPTFLLLSSIAFDSSVAGIYGTLLTGGTLVLPGDGAEKDIPKLAALIQTHQVTHTLCLPSVYRLLLEFADPYTLASLDTAVVAGEVLDTALLKQHRLILPDCRLYNEYGPTEACVWCAVHACSSSDGTTVSLGHSLSKTPVMVVNSRLEPCPQGVVGEILVGGPGLARGYRNDPDRTEAAFVTLAVAQCDRQRWYRTGDRGYIDDDQRLMFNGRTDRQIKLRGQRIELDDIESVVRAHPLVSEAVLTIEGKPADSTKRLVLFFITDDQGLNASPGHSAIATPVAVMSDATELVKWLRQRLPPVMWPSQTLWLTAMPQLPNGKLDRNALYSGNPALSVRTVMPVSGARDKGSIADQVQTVSSVPATAVSGPDPLLDSSMSVVHPSAMQQLTLNTAAKVLGNPELRLGDNFFQMGGDSIAAMRFCAGLQIATGVSVSFRLLLDCRHLGDVARLLEGVPSMTQTETGVDTSLETGEI